MSLFFAALTRSSLLSTLSQSFAAAYTATSASCKVSHYIHFKKNLTHFFLQIFHSWYIRNYQKCISTLFYSKIMLLSTLFSRTYTHKNVTLLLFVSLAQIGVLLVYNKSTWRYCFSWRWVERSLVEFILSNTQNLLATLICYLSYQSVTNVLLSSSNTWSKKREEMVINQLQSEKASIQMLPEFLINVSNA